MLFGLIQRNSTFYASSLCCIFTALYRMFRKSDNHWQWFFIYLSSITTFFFLKKHTSLDDTNIFGIVLHSQTLTCQKNFGLAADQQAIAILGSTVVLANIAVAPLFAFLKALDQQCAICQDPNPRAGGYGHPIFAPRDHDWFVTLDLTV